MRTLLAIITLLVTLPARANDSASTDALSLELRAMAADFAKIVEKKGGGAVAIGEFSGSTDVKGSVGPRLQLALAAELKALKIAIDNDSFRFEIKGDYQPVEDKETKLLGVKLVGRLIDRETGEPLAEKPTGRFVFGAETVPGMLGLTVANKPTTDPRELSDNFKKAKAAPNASRQGTRVAANDDSPYALEILVKNGANYQARAVHTDDKGRLLVPLDRSEIYGVRLINDSPHDAAVDLRLDGINSFEFSEIKSKFWILKPHSQLDVKGWHKNNQTSLEFKVVDFPETAAAKLNLKPSAAIGLITASFSAAWADDAGRPADEPRVTGRGTGFGSEINVKTEQVKRTIGQVRDTISVRYER